MNKVSLVVWRDAKTDPPVEDEWTYMVWFDEGPGYVGFADYLANENMYGEVTGSAWYDARTGDYLDPQPSLYADPSPPGDDALTLDHLIDLCTWVQDSDAPAIVKGWAARLDCAFEEVEGT